MIATSKRGFAAIFAVFALVMFGLQARAADERVLSFFIETSQDAIAITHGGKDAGLKPFPEGILTLAGTNIANTLALTARISDASGALVGLATELEDFPTAIMDHGAQVWDTYWTLMIVGRGSLFLYEKESLGPDVARVFSETRNGSKDWHGSLTHPSNVGPLPSGEGIVVGGTGEFTGATGSFQEIGTLKRFTTEGELDARIELRVRLSAN